MAPTWVSTFFRRVLMHNGAHSDDGYAPVILPPFRRITWDEIQDCQTREGKGPKSQKRKGTENVKIYPDHDDTSDEAFLFRHHKDEREEKLLHYYYRTVHNNDCAEKFDKRVEQAIKHAPPPAIHQGDASTRLHRPCRLLCTCCYCPKCVSLGMEAHQSVASSKSNQVDSPPSAFKTNGPCKSNGQEEDGPAVSSFKSSGQAVHYNSDVAAESSSKPLRCVSEASAVHGSQPKKYMHLRVEPNEKRLRQTISPTYVVSAADSRELQCALAQQPKTLFSAPELAAGYMAVDPSRRPFARLKAPLSWPCIRYERPMRQEVRVTTLMCPTSRQTRPLRPVNWRWDMGMELPKPDQRGTGHALTPAPKKVYKVQRSVPPAPGHRPQAETRIAWDSNAAENAAVQEQSLECSDVMQDEAADYWALGNVATSDEGDHAFADDGVDGSYAADGGDAPSTADGCEEYAEPMQDMEREMEYGMHNLLHPQDRQQPGPRDAQPNSRKGKKRKKGAHWQGQKKKKTSDSKLPPLPLLELSSQSAWAAYHIAVCDEDNGKPDYEEDAGLKLRMHFAGRMLPVPLRKVGIEEGLQESLQKQVADSRRRLQQVSQDLDTLSIPCGATEHSGLPQGKHPVFGDLNGLQHQLEMLVTNPQLQPLMRPFLEAIEQPCEDTYVDGDSGWNCEGAAYHEQIMGPDGQPYDYECSDHDEAYAQTAPCDDGDEACLEAQQDRHEDYDNHEGEEMQEPHGDCQSMECEEQYEGCAQMSLDELPAELHSKEADDFEGDITETDNAGTSPSATTPYKSASTNTSGETWTPSGRFKVSTGTCTEGRIASSTAQTASFFGADDSAHLDQEPMPCLAEPDTPIAAPPLDSLSEAPSPMMPPIAVTFADFCGDTEGMPSPLIPREDVPSADFCGNTEDELLTNGCALSSSSTNTEPLCPLQEQDPGMCTSPAYTSSQMNLIHNL